MPGSHESGNWNENNLNPLSRIHWRESLVRAAAVIPAPIAYIKVVVVEKLVVGSQQTRVGLLCVILIRYCAFAGGSGVLLTECL